MATFTFSKLIPGGNPTVLLHEPDVEEGELADLASRIMSPLHLGAEQVGALYSARPEDSPGLPRLTMMGGEFCVNATRSAALLLTRRGGLPLAARLPASGLRQPVWRGEMLVSGMDAPVGLAVSPLREALESALDLSLEGMPDAPEEGRGERGERDIRRAARQPRLFCAARVPCEERVTFDSPAPGLIRVRLPGIVHVLADTRLHPLPDVSGNAWKEAGGSLRAAAGVADEPASGIVWHTEEQGGMRIWPAVQVRATASEHLESACGSASLAVALWLWSRPGHKAAAVGVIQPSGEILRIHPDFSRPGGVWVSGPVFLAARGLVNL